jgi:hypothetical protein
MISGFECEAAAIGTAKVTCNALADIVEAF